LKPHTGPLKEFGEREVSCADLNQSISLKRRADIRICPIKTVGAVYDQSYPNVARSASDLSRAAA
jgi:hypothetical protein